MPPMFRETNVKGVFLEVGEEGEAEADNLCMIMLRTSSKFTSIFCVLL